MTTTYAILQGAEKVIEGHVIHNAGPDVITVSVSHSLNSPIWIATCPDLASDRLRAERDRQREIAEMAVREIQCAVERRKDAESKADRLTVENGELRAKVERLSKPITAQEIKRLLHDQCADWYDRDTYHDAPRPDKPTEATPKTTQRIPPGGTMSVRCEGGVMMYVENLGDKEAHLNCRWTFYAPKPEPEPVRVYHIDRGEGCHAVEDPAMKCPHYRPIESGGCRTSDDCPTHFDSNGRTW